MYTHPFLVSLVASLSKAASIHRGDHSHSLARRAAGVPSSLPASWSYYGCYSDSVSSRSLSKASYYDAAMTDESCISFCASKGYTFAGTEYGQECFCDYSITSQLDNSLPGGCNMFCSGDSTELCGGPDRLSVFTISKSSPVENSGPNGWNTLGCYTDSVSARTLSIGTTVPGGASTMTVALCTSACGNAGYHFAGVEYSGECFCDHQLENNPSSVLDGCDMPCTGNPEEICGGPNRLDAYSFSGSSSTTSSVSLTTTISSTSSTVNAATSTSSSAPFTP